MDNFIVVVTSERVRVPGYEAPGLLRELAGFTLGEDEPNRARGADSVVPWRLVAALSGADEVTCRIEQEPAGAQRR